MVFSPQILRSMLYRGSEIMREVAWVVFDEIHYMRDAGMSTTAKSSRLAVGCKLQQRKRYMRFFCVDYVTIRPVLMTSLFCLFVFRARCGLGGDHHPTS